KGRISLADWALDPVHPSFPPRKSDIGKDRPSSPVQRNLEGLLVRSILKPSITKTRKPGFRSLGNRSSEDDLLPRIESRRAKGRIGRRLRREGKDPGRAEDIGRFRGALIDPKIPQGPLRKTGDQPQVPARDKTLQGHQPNEGFRRNF